MSEPDKEKSAAAGCVSGGNDEEDGGGGKKHKCEGRVRKAKRLALVRFRKLKNQIQRRKRRICSSANLGRSGCGVGGCCLSLMKSPNLDSISPVESPTSDPNHPEFSFDLLRSLIEKNDFYSSECNTHFDDIDSD